MSHAAITEQEFTQFQKLIYDIAGINLSAAKKPLVSGRLAKRLAHHGAGSYGDYFRILQKDAGHGELQIAVDLLTTNFNLFLKIYIWLRFALITHFLISVKINIQCCSSDSRRQGMPEAGFRVHFQCPR